MGLFVGGFCPSDTFSTRSRNYLSKIVEAALAKIITGVLHSTTIAVIKTYDTER